MKMSAQKDDPRARSSARDMDTALKEFKGRPHAEEIAVVLKIMKMTREARAAEAAQQLCPSGYLRLMID